MSCTMGLRLDFTDYLAQCMMGGEPWGGTWRLMEGKGTGGMRCVYTRREKKKRAKEQTDGDDEL